MKKLFLIAVGILFSISPYIGTQVAYAACDYTTPGVQVVSGPDGSTSYICPTTATSGGGVTTVVGQSTGNGQTTVTTTQAPTPAAPTPTPVTSCPNGGELKNGVCNLGYTPLEPIPGITQGVNGYDLTSPGGFAKFINAIFTILITGGALLAVLSLTLGGVQYMTSSTLGNKTAGIERARAAIYGILIIAATYLILNTINPQLLNFNFIACAGGNCQSSINSFTQTNGFTTTSASNTTNTGATSNNGVIQSPYGNINTANNTNLDNSTGCANSGGTWKYFTNASGGWSTGGTCYVGAAQTGVGASPY